jgi:polyisoprenoid-binding protein YceI
MRNLIALIVLIAAPAWADGGAPGTFSVDAQRSSITFYLVHKLHKFQGSSKKVEGKARILPTGQVQVGVRAPIESFDSGNVNRDEHMKETVDAARFPLVELKALLDGVPAPASFPFSVEKKAQAQVLFHGVTRPMEIPVRITFESAERVTAASSFSVSLDAFQIDRPSLMFVKVENDMKVDANLVFAK